jgi:Flp pilus assembly pilin Flp
VKGFLNRFGGVRLDFFGARFMMGLLDPSSLFDLRREKGQTLAEYALILALIAVAVVTAVVLLGGKIKGLFNTVGSSI